MCKIEELSVKEQMKVGKLVEEIAEGRGLDIKEALLSGNWVLDNYAGDLEQSVIDLINAMVKDVKDNKED